jgi:prophage regulatory protein
MSDCKKDYKIMRRPDVERITGLSRSGIYAGIQDGTFPPQIKLGLRSVGWIEGEVQQWLHDRIAETRGGMSHV